MASRVHTCHQWACGPLAPASAVLSRSCFPCPAVAGRGVLLPLPTPSSSRNIRKVKCKMWEPSGLPSPEKTQANPLPVLYLQKAPRGPLCFLKPSTRPPSVHLP